MAAQRAAIQTAKSKITALEREHYEKIQGNLNSVDPLKIYGELITSGAASDRDCQGTVEIKRQVFKLIGYGGPQNERLRQSPAVQA